MADLKTKPSRRIAGGTLIALVFAAGLAPGVAHGQAGLRDALERLDQAGDNDGRIDPEEITPLARPYLEKLYRQRRYSMDRDVDIDKLQEASRIYHAFQNGVANESVRPEKVARIRGFEPDDDQVLVPEFGLGKVKYPYTQDDLDEADDQLRRYDRDRDGYINRYEARRARWRNVDPFESDENSDDRLSRLELAQRYARRRLLRDDSGELLQRIRRVGNGIEPARRTRNSGRGDSGWWRGSSRNWLTASIMGRFDANRNGRLEAQEVTDMNLPVSEIDADRDGELSREELNFYLTSLQDEIGDEAEGLPGWFYELDQDGDGQVSMTEFAQDWTPEKLNEFSLLDGNRDGLLTSWEVATSKAIVGGSFSNETAEPLPPKRTIISEVAIEDNVLIGDLNVQLSVTHTNVGDLDAFLTGPDGQRVELFTEIGGSGNHFEETIFDDESDNPITKARPPYEGVFQTEEKTRNQPGLDQFKGTSARGIWQLVVRGTRSERFGMLHRWALLIRPQEQLVGDLASAAGNEEPDDGDAESDDLDGPGDSQDDGPVR